MPALSALLCSAVLTVAQEPGSCAVCHGREALALSRSPHLAAGVGCTACHGGVDGLLEQEAAHGPELRPLRDPGSAVEACGSCHADVGRMRTFGLATDQLALYRTSRHGQAVFERGDAQSATCVSCHGAHDVLPPADARSPVHERNQVATCGRCHSDAALMQARGLRSDAPELYRDSVHGRALLQEGRRASPACSDCHGSHGAVPPRAEAVGTVCGQCHAMAAEYFRAGPHGPTARHGAMEECVSCHGNHAVSQASAELLLGSEPGHCGSCHAGEEDVLAVAAGIHDRLAALDRDILDTAEVLRRAASRGLFLEEEEAYLGDARGLRERARGMTHSASLELLADVDNRGQAMIQQTLESLDVKRRQFRDRRIFTAAYAVVAALLVAVLLIYRREL
ncbi:MAG: hypothetical protein EYC70_02285 [Planctomycetota bacterium]|nr:MAG: hypothetical protein EYC70_02285 [Planctomycetota bacterium]